jgi:membrane protease YdiL (CAAX protease family)
MQKKQWSCDWFVVFVVIALLLIPLYYLIPGMPLFKPFEAVGNASIYGFIVFVVLIFDFLWWVVEESKDKRFKEKVLKTLGFRWSRLQIAAGLAIGCSTEVLTPKVESRFSSMASSIGLEDMLLVPPIEEVLFRGHLINRLLRSDKTLRRRILAIAASILTFAWMHASYPEQKVIGGTVFTAVYLWGWKNNMTAAIAAHLGSNATILLSKYQSLGIARVACIIILMVFVFSLLWFVCHLTVLFRESNSAKE